MRIASFNMRQGGSAEHWSQLAAATDADLVLAQETRDPRPWQEDPGSGFAAGELLWQAVPDRRWGSALYCRTGTLREVAVPGFEGLVVGGRLETGAISLMVFSVHLAPDRGSYLKAAQRLCDELAPIVRRTPLLLGGDWNFTCCPRVPGDPREHRRGELDVLARLREDFDLAPAWRLAHPDGALPQTLRWMREPSTPYHCDGIFLPALLSCGEVSARVLAGSPWLELSDHNPVFVEAP